jgi:hypothetical protein
MKKADVLQLSIVLIGVVYGFVALQYVLTSLLGILLWVFGGGYGADGLITSSLPFLVSVALQVICCWLLIVKSAGIAEYFYKLSDLGTGFKIVSKPNNLLHILLIITAIYLLLTNLAPLLNAIFISFKQKMQRGTNGLFEDQRPIEWTKLILDIILPVVLLFFTKPIADYFAKNIGEEPISIEESFDVTKNAETKEP